MGVLESIAQGKRFSIEVVPPSRGAGLDDLFRVLEGIMPFGPAFASVTDHPGGAAYGDGAAGPVLMPLRAKPGTLGTCLAIRGEFDVETVPHVVAAGTDRFTVEDVLIDLHYAGFRDLFAIRGDERFSALRTARALHSGEGYGCAAELVAHISALNRGEYSPPAAHGHPTAFRVGVAGYPGKHYAAPNPEADLRRLKEKVDAGASYVITQMVFEARQYFDFTRRLRALGADVPVIPGLKPLTRAAQASSIPSNFFVDVPEALLRALEDARSPGQERAVGLIWTANLAAELLEGGAPSLHFFTMGKGGVTRDALAAIFGQPGGGAPGSGKRGEA
ncbi:MAG: methylenetetrahydrofolate reductase [Spirochaetes bacterium]|nr:methylenetetrahydrofolate reductase [Spirochaetota bacterium]